MAAAVLRPIRPTSNYRLLRHRHDHPDDCRGGYLRNWPSASASGSCRTSVRASTHPEVWSYSISGGTMTSSVTDLMGGLGTHRSSNAFPSATAAAAIAINSSGLAVIAAMNMGTVTALSRIARAVFFTTRTPRHLPRLRRGARACCLPIPSVPLLPRAAGTTRRSTTPGQVVGIHRHPGQHLACGDVAERRHHRPQHRVCRHLARRRRVEQRHGHRQ